MILLYFFTVYMYISTICTYACTYISIESTFFHEIIFSFRLFLKMLRIEQQQELEEPIEFLLHKQFFFLFCSK